MSPDARLMSGITLVLVPTIAYGGLTVLGVISNGYSGPLDRRICRRHRLPSTARAMLMREYSRCSRCSFKSRWTMLRSPSHWSGPFA